MWKDCERSTKRTKDAMKHGVLKGTVINRKAVGQTDKMIDNMTRRGKKSSEIGKVWAVPESKRSRSRKI